MVERDKVLEALRSLDGDHALRRLLVRVLGYEAEGGLVSGEGWPEELDGEPELFATAGREGRFAVIRARLNTSGRLSLTAERRTIERLRDRYPYALYVFSDAEDRVWHFVNAPYAERAGGKQYRRMVVGPDEELRTATDRISMLSMDDLAEKLGKESDELSPLDVQAAHDQAFDVERVTKEFFREYASVFARVEGLVEGLADPERKRLFTQRLFNRLMFLAFIQKKGWLRFGERQDYLPALFEAYSRDEYDENFYRDRLKHLFFTGLNSPDEVDIIGINEGGYLRDVIGDVPYLNGGLFEKDEDDRDEGVVVPDEAIALILQDLFGQFNFTITESTPLDVEVAVDPEMLGRVFEELVTGRHETGSYYTPKPIVSFMCREALKGHLGAKLAQDSPEAVRQFVEEHDPSDLRNPEGALEALQSVRVCDPACGSGAYLLGMLHELLDLRASLFATRSLDPISNYERKLEIIQRNLYGVDIDTFAVNIARLRLWLSLVVEFEGEEGQKPPPLPNLDFKIEVGDSLTAPDPSGGSQTDLARGTDIKDLYRLKDEYLRAHGEEKRRLKARIDEMRRQLSDWLHPGKEPEGFDWQVEFAEVFTGEDGEGGLAEDGDGAGQDDSEGLGFLEEAEEDGDLVDLGEALEMFRQMREEDPEGFERIASLRDGIRAARRAGEVSGAESGETARQGAYVYCRAGAQGRFYFVDAASGAAEEAGTQSFLKALRCEPEEPGAPLPMDHNALVGAAMRRFGAHLGRMRAQSAAQPELPPAQRYVLSELRKIHGELWAPEEVREKAERLEEAFRFEASSAVKRELRSLHRARSTGEDLVGALEELYAKYRLGEERRESEERRRRSEAEGTPRVVCGEAAR